MKIKCAGESFSDAVTYGSDGAMAARREQILNEAAEAIANPKYRGSRPYEHAFREAIGPLVSTMGGRVAGGALGAIVAKIIGKDVGSGMRIGGYSGMGASLLANIIGSLAAAKTKRRTREEQLEHDKGPTWASLLVPGVGAYNHFKRQGRAFAENDDRIRERVVAKVLARKMVSKMLSKRAGADGGIWESVKDFLDRVKAWYSELRPMEKSLVGIGGGALAGGLIGSILSERGEFMPGAVLGGLGGLAASDINWSSFLNNGNSDNVNQTSAPPQGIPGNQGG